MSIGASGEAASPSDALPLRVKSDSFEDSILNRAIGSAASM